MISNGSGGDGAHSQEAAAQRSGGGGSARGLKKGPWTAAEDAILMEYVKKHGEGNWNAVQKNSGLARCGKSCRLRWANHLRPNLKKGSLTADEERIIIELHAKIGNKWARMASQLPGRTDNEIKNYWNTRMKRRQRAGLPIYPHELQQEAAAAAAAAATAAFHHHQQQQQLHHHQQQQQQQKRLRSSSSSFSSLLSSSHPHHKPSNNYTTTPSSLSLYDHITPFSSDHAVANNPLHHNNSSLYTSNAAAMAQFNGGSNGGFAMPLSPVSQFGLSSSPLFNQSSVPNQTLLTPSLHEYNSGGFGDYNLSLSSMIMGPLYEPSTAHVIPGSEPELPSNQTPPYSGTRPSSSSGGEGPMLGASGIANVNHENRINAAVSGQTGNSGLLDDVLVEAQNRSTKRSRSCENESSSGLSAKDKGVMEKEYSTDEHDDQEAEDNVQVESSALKINSSEINSADQNHRDDKLSSSPPSIGMKASEEDQDPLEEMDDDLLSLLNFPSTMPAVSDQSWYLGCSATSNRPASTSCPSTNIENHYEGLDIDHQQNVPLETLPVKSTSTSAPDPHEVERNSTQLGSSSSCYWNNMPGIC